MPQPGDTIADKYKVNDVLGVGGMGAVFAATHILTGKRVALKWLLPGVDELEGAEERLLREAKATARIDHPNVVNVFDVGRHASGLFLVMEQLSGESLAECLQRSRVDVTTGIAMLLPALRGVMAAHDAGVVHRDLKPDNLFLCCDQAGDYVDSKVLDFGISKLLTSEEAALTATGAMLGTPWYMAPEQVRGAKGVDARADIYALGVILYELIGDGYPFEADSMGSLMFKIVMDAPRPLRELASDLNPQLAAVVEKAMAKDPAARFATVHELALALEPFAGGATYSRTSVLSVDRGSASTPLPIARSLLDSQTTGEQHGKSSSGDLPSSRSSLIDDRARPSTPSGDESKGFTIIGQPTPSSMPVAVELSARPRQRSVRLRAIVGASMVALFGLAGIWALGGLGTNKNTELRNRTSTSTNQSPAQATPLTGANEGVRVPTGLPIGLVAGQPTEGQAGPSSSETPQPAPHAAPRAGAESKKKMDGLSDPVVQTPQMDRSSDELSKVPTLKKAAQQRADRAARRRVRRSKGAPSQKVQKAGQLSPVANPGTSSVSGASEPADSANGGGLQENWDELVQPRKLGRGRRKPNAGLISADDF